MRPKWVRHPRVVEVDSGRLQGASAPWMSASRSDAGNRVFDVLIDGTRVATQRLEKNRAGEFLRRGLIGSH